jgi:hypothetical protein
VFRRVLANEPPDARFTAAAHHGLLISAMAASDWNAALKAGWCLLQAGRSGTLPRADVLVLVAELCRRIGHHGIAIRAAEAALRIAFRPDQTITALQVLVDIAAATSDRSLGRRYGPTLRRLVGGSAGPFEDARALLTLAGLEHTCGSRDVARDDLARAQVIAEVFHYHELQFEADKLLQVFACDSMPPRSDNDARESAEAVTWLDGRSRSIVSQLDRWSEHDLIGTVVGPQ